MFAMTFFIVLFIVLMQFLWRYIDDLVGKGLSIGVLAELFFYAAVSMVPMALPLAILLASLMTFGNLGEKSELTAIKAAGIPLIKVMSPLIGLVSLIAVGAFFFQNDLLPKAQVKMWTLLFSARQKSPELEIPEGVFYDQIPGYNLYVKDKDKNTGMLRDVMIYDVSRGGDNATIIRSDSARLAFTKDMRYLYLHLWNGEQFENLREQRTNDRNVPFRRESFRDKEVVISFDANFNRLDEEGMKNQYIGQNISQLRVSIDSLDRRIDSIGNETQKSFEASAFPGLFAEGSAMEAIRSAEGGMPYSRSTSFSRTSPNQLPSSKPKGEEKVTPLNLDSLLRSLNPGERDAVFGGAANLVRLRSSEMEFRAMQISDEKARERRSRIELIKKFTLSVACIIFLFIGAPLGAIIRKGGLGTPLVISVLLFLVYYIIDNTGYKLARDGHWVVWCGMWLSTFILLPLGVFVTYKAMNDSAVFNADLYKEWFRRVLGLPDSRHVPLKEVVINDVDMREAREKLVMLRVEAQRRLRTQKCPTGYVDYWHGGCRAEEVERIADHTEEVVKYMSDSRDVKVISLLNRFPVVSRLWILNPGKNKQMRRVLMWFVPVGFPIWLLSIPYQRRVRSEIEKVAQTATELL